jgi:predicted site-specific integrase-resolvase
MTGVIYARYSSENQREESIEGQIRENTAFAEKDGIFFRLWLWGIDF